MRDPAPRPVAATAFHRRLSALSETAIAQLAEALAPLLRTGDALLLEGGLGAGKTHFARALIQARLAAAGRIEDVPSPTFTLVQIYDDGAAEVWHCDLYRLESVDEVMELGLEDAFDDAICLVEWPDRLGGMRPAGALTLEFRSVADGAARDVIATSDDPRWHAVLDAAGAPAHV